MTTPPTIGKQDRRGGWGGVGEVGVYGLILGCGQEMLEGDNVEGRWVEAAGLQRRFALDWTTSNTAA